MPFTHRRQTKSNSSSRSTTQSWKPALLSLFAALAIVSSLAITRPRSSEAKLAKRTPVESFDVGMKMQRFNIQLGTDTATKYRGTNALAQSLPQGQARSLAMAAEDLNGDGMPDLLVGYSAYGRGLVTLRLGNLEAIAPQTPEVFEGLRVGRYPSPFLNDVTSFDLPEAPQSAVSKQPSNGSQRQPFVLAVYCLLIAVCSLQFY